MQNAPDHDHIRILLHGYQTPVTVNIDTYLQMVQWTRLAAGAQPMTLADAAAELLPLAALAVEALFRAGQQDEAARLAWAAAKLREVAGGR